MAARRANWSVTSESHRDTESELQHQGNDKHYTGHSRAIIEQIRLVVVGHDCGSGTVTNGPSSITRSNLKLRIPQVHPFSSDTIATRSRASASSHSISW